MISNPTCKDFTRELIQHFNADAPFRLSVSNREDLEITEYNLEKSLDGSCWLTVRVEEVKNG